MRDIFEDIFENRPSDPMEAARRNMRPNPRARFYNEASVGEAEQGVQVLLDGRPVRTPARHLLTAPSRNLAEAIANEWNAQEQFIDPANMPLTRLANSIIDGVSAAPDAVAAEIGKYLGTDMLFYRASEPGGLVERQQLHWDPIIEWARDALGARFVLAEGVMHVEQPAEAMSAASTMIPAAEQARDRWRLGAMNVITTLTGSTLLALALASGRVTPDETWAAAHVDEDWNMHLWGRDEIAMQRRTERRKEFDAAATVLEAFRPS